jgi:glycosyltransferase involved in cell wall biosynthesis
MTDPAAISTRSTAHRPRVSIGVPVYNGAEYLAVALESLIRQTFRDLEIIVSDNASTDQSAGIARVYAALDSRVRVVESRVNVGGNGNFQRVLELARGEYFKWAAHDDLCEPDFVERCVEVLDRDPSVVCCHSRTDKIDRAGRPVPALGDPTLVSARGSDPRAHVRFRDVLLHSGYAARSFGLIRRAELEACRPLVPVYGSEKVLMAELALRGRYHDVEDVLFHLRVHATSASALGSAAEQQVFAAPSCDEGRLTVRLRLLAGYVGAVRRAPVPVGEKARCGIAILAYLLQLRKWRRVVWSLFTDVPEKEEHLEAELAAGERVR